MRKGNETKKRRKLLPAMLAVALAAVMIVPMGSGLARAAEGEGTITLNVQETTDEYGVFGQDLAANADVAYFKIAEGIKDGSYDTYKWTLVDPFNTKDMNDLLKTAQEKADDKPISENTEAYTNLAAMALEIVLGNDTITPAGTASIGSPTDTLLQPGFYLAVPRQLTDGEAAIKEEEGNVTVTTDDFIYTFDPTLISVPTKAEREEDGSRGTAADYGPWIENVEITTKATRVPALGSIAVQKTLETYETTDPATFVFSIVATKGKNADGTDKVVYRDVVSITMDHPGTSDLRIIEKKIPVNSTVTVKEIYAGANYDISDAEEHPEVATGDITEETTASIASFTNDYDGKHKGGGSIENRFTKEEGATNWTPEQVYSKTAPSEE